MVANNRKLPNPKVISLNSETPFGEKYWTSFSEIVILMEKTNRE